ncbi:MAG: RNA polymerase sigma factor [Planctomycetota bacterium]|nr:RNA polymerase sigma factor [Planctomycetota bacterium]
MPDSFEPTSASPDAEAGDDVTAPAMQDDSLAAAAISGDADALQRLWSLNRRWVAAILLAHKPRWADVEDLLQEVALSMVRKLTEVRDPRAVRPWLRTVAVNIAHAAARSGKRRSADERLGEAADDSRQGRGRDFTQAPESLSELAHGRILLSLASQLPDGYREPLLLKALQDLSYREIGEILDLPETTIETRIARGRRMLRELASKNNAFSSLA